MRKRTYSTVNAGVEGSAIAEEDLSILRKPLNTAITGFLEAKRAFENGTDEVRRLLLQECSLIYECSVCRNLFRSLANFISHKRIFCCSHNLNNANGYPDQSSSVIIQTPDLKTTKCRSNSLMHDERAENDSLDKVIERLKRDQSASVATVHDTTQILSTNTVLQLEPVPSSTQAVYQTLKREEADNIKLEVDELQNMLNKNETVVGANGKAIHNSFQDSEELSEKQTDGQFACDICNLSFQTEKTLKLHTQRNHNSSTFVFQCPACPQTFLQPAAVIRHLANEHKKPVRRIRMMRESILKRRIQLGDVQVKAPNNRELKRLQMRDSFANTAEADKETNEATKMQKKIMTECVYCERSFERRAALSTHLIKCRAKHLAELEKTIGAVKRSKLELTAEVQKPTESTGIQHKIKIEPKDTESERATETDTDTLNEMFANLGSFGSGLQTVKLNSLETETLNYTQTDETAIKTDAEKIPNINDVKNEQTKCKVEEPPDKSNVPCRCKICNKRFNALSNLRRHISMFHYRARKFGCTLCDYRAFRRYDIVNHLGFVHKMSGERETMATDYVAVHEVHYSKDDVDADIVLIAEEPGTQMQEPEKCMKTYEKRGKRNKTQQISADVSNSANTAMAEETPTLRPKLKRSSSQQPVLQKRPIRNRIKPVNKDFVYDLTDLLKKDGTSTTTSCNHDEPLRKRKSTNCHGNDECALQQHSELTPLLSSSTTKLIKGAAQRLMLLRVSQGHAASATLPQLPAERPQMRPRLTSTYRGDMQQPAHNVSVIETRELEAARLNSTLLDDTFLEKISKHSTVAFRMRPCLTLQHGTLSSLLKKVDNSIKTVPAAVDTTAANNVELLPAPTTTTTSIDDTSSYQPIIAPSSPASNGTQFFSPEQPTIPSAISPPSTPRKRITLMQRLADNKAKRRDSVLRTALEN